MNETNEINPANPDTRRDMLLAKAKMMGLKISPNIGVDALAAKVNAALDAEDKSAADKVKDDGVEDTTINTTPPPLKIAAGLAETAPSSKPAAEETENQKRSRLQREAMRLVRIRLTCMNPNKKDLHGEIFTVGNKYIGTVKKFIPFNMGDEGYHVPHCIFEELKNRKFLHIATQDKRNGQIQVKPSDVAEFAIEVLPQLTPKELSKLAQRQQMAAGTAPVEAE